MNPTKEQILLQLRGRWDGILDEGDDLNIDIELFTADGNSGQPLAYDIIQHNGSNTVTYTCVEMPDAVESALGLAAVSYDQAVETLRNLLVEAHSLVNDTVANDTVANDTVANDTVANDTVANDTVAKDTATSDDPAEVVLTSVIKTDDLGMTYGRYRTQGKQESESFPTSYQAYFITNLLRTHQYNQSGVLFNQVIASLDSSKQFSLRFGN